MSHVPTSSVIDALVEWLKWQVKRAMNGSASTKLPKMGPQKYLKWALLSVMTMGVDQYRHLYYLLFIDNKFSKMGDKTLDPVKEYLFCRLS